MRIRNLILALAAFAAPLAAQQTGAPLRLVPSEPLSEPHPAQSQTKPAAPDPAIRPAILKLKPPSDPIYLVDEPAPESEIDKWRTYRRPKVDPFSNNSRGVAIQGYDVVSYLENRPEPGREEFTAEHGGVVWRFATAEHRDLFREDPSRYVPEYGGFCAYSVGRGYPATADPRAFAVESGKLYLFFDKAVRTVWEQDRARLIVAADRNWPRLHR